MGDGAAAPAALTRRVQQWIKFGANVERLVSGYTTADGKCLRLQCPYTGEPFLFEARFVGAAPTPAQQLAQAQAALSMAMPSWQAIQQAVAASQAPGSTGWVNESYVVVLKAASEFACEAASLAVQAAAGYAPRCAAAASAASSAKPCPGLDLTGETGQGTPWGIIWNGQVNVLDRNLVPQVGAQVSQAQASVQAAIAARDASCPLPELHLRPLRFSGGTSDFSSLDPTFQAVFNNGPGAQMQAEGVGAADISAYQQQFADQFNALVGPYNGVDPMKLAGAAAQYVGLGNTISGAQQLVGGLISAAQSGSASQIINAFCGVAIAEVGTVVAAGAVSAGVGAAIVVGLEVASTLIGNAFQTPAPTAQVAGCGLPYTPSFVIPGSEVWCRDGIPTKGGPSQASYSRWRQFPNPQNLPYDSWWFQNGTGIGGDCGATSWANAGCLNTEWDHGNGWQEGWSACMGKTGPAWRPIDGACFENNTSVYAQLESDNTMLWTLLVAGSNLQAVAVLQALQSAFFAAWKANREFDFNGLARQADWQVLQQVIIRWNMAREPGQGVSLPLATWNPATYGSAPNPGACYMQMVLNDLQSNGSQFATTYDPSTGRGILNSDGSIHVNTGPLKALPVQLPPIHLHIPPGLFSGPRKMSTGKKIAIGTGVAVAGVTLGTLLYSFLTHQAVEYVVEKAVDRMGRELAKPSRTAGRLGARARTRVR